MQLENFQAVFSLSSAITCNKLAIWGKIHANKYIHLLIRVSRGMKKNCRDEKKTRFKK
jgi:hypothetical protein